MDPTVDEGENQDTGDLTQLELSKLSSNGFNATRTLKLFSYVGDSKLLTMIDSGASHYFISDKMAQHLRLAIDFDTTFAVIFGDGTRKYSQGVCTVVPLRIADHLFSITCYVFPLHSVDVILGVS